MSGAVLAAMIRRAIVTPSPTPNWANITFASGVGGSNANQTISGTTVAISLTWISDAFEGAGGTIAYVLNDGAAVPIAHATNFSVPPGATLRFDANDTGAGGPYTIQIRNASDGDAVLDSFTVTVT